MCSSDLLRSGVNVVVFPEGTRTPADAPEHVFHRGAAHMAIQSDSPVETVSMRCDLEILAKRQPWWDVGDRTATYSVRCKGSLDPSAFVRDGQSRKATAANLTARMGEGVFG